MSDSATPWSVACQPLVHGISQARILVWVAVSTVHFPELQVLLLLICNSTFNIREYCPLSYLLQTFFSVSHLSLNWCFHTEVLLSLMSPPALCVLLKKVCLKPRLQKYSVFLVLKYCRFSALSELHGAKHTSMSFQRANCPKAIWSICLRPTEMKNPFYHI